MSTRLVGAVYYLELPPHLKLTLSALADHADDDGGGAYPGMDLLALKTSCQRRQAQRNVRDLEERGYVATDIQGGGSAKTRPDRRPNEYRLSADRIAAEAATNRKRYREQNGAAPTTPRASTDGAAPKTERGGVDDNDGAAPTPPEPSKEQTSEEPSSLARPDRPRDAVWDALVAIFGAAPIRKSLRGAWNEACAELKAQGATPQEVALRFARYRADMPNAACTPMSLAKHWGRYAEDTPATRPVGKFDASRARRRLGGRQAG